MAKLTTKEKAVVLSGILSQYGIESEIRVAPQEKGKEARYVVSPDFVFLLGIHGQQDGYTVHVMADAAIAILIMEQVNRSCPGLVSYGPFAMRGHEILSGEEAIAAKDSFIMMRAYQITKERDAKAAQDLPTEPVEEKSRIILATS